MKRTIKYIIGITCSLAAVFSCARFDEQELHEKGKMERVVFSAVIKDGQQTKTALGGDIGDEYRKILWQPDDSVGIIGYDYNGSYYRSKFINTEIEESETASLAGEMNGWSRFYGFYPYSEDLWLMNIYEITFNQPSLQTYRENSFNANAMPMVARSSAGDVFEFYSLAGVLAVNLTGTQTVKSVSFSGHDESGSPIPVAGTFSVRMDYDEYPVMTPYMYGTPLSSITLDCGDGVVLDPVKPTAFYIVLPVGTYDSFTVTVNTTDGKLMLKKGSNPLEIKRANVTKAKQLAFVEEIAIDLSEHGTANSYIVPEPGLYSFAANVIGNGGYGIVDGAKFHTEDPYITPKKAKLLWEDRAGVVNNVTSDDNKVTFVSSGQEGNALVGVVDETGTILWSWHIWVTDQPAEQTYVNGENQYVMLDRNLGAVRADRGEGEQWKDAVGLMYQWGRKDPLTFNANAIDSYNNTMYTTSTEVVPVNRSIEEPTVFFGAGYYYWNETGNRSLWSSSQKTIYDPCPVGYVTPHRDVWLTFSNIDSYWNSSLSQINISGTYDNGMDLIYDGSNTTYYPSRSKIDHNGNLETFNPNHISLWSTDISQNDGYNVYLFKAYYYTYVDSWLSMDQTNYMTAAHSVRCMKDDGYVDAAKPLVKIVGTKNLTAESVTLEAIVADEGSSSVVERGIIWGTVKNLSLDNGNVEKAQEGGRGNFSIAVTGLQPSTRYYYKAYARNEQYVSYSDVKYFYTPYDGNVFNLSQEGTANCYIVPPVCAEYAFNATVKGNSGESVGEIATAEVLWETALKYDNIKVNEIISEVFVKGNNIHFILAPEVEDGNALIAVKDAAGKILWSWHIWVVDFDPEETQQTYQSGAVMMDRNLGATTVIPAWKGAETTDYSAYGLYYQWGRKDPFPYLGNIAPTAVVKLKDYTNNVETASQNPTTVYVSPMWIDDTMWQSSKTMYDPCPRGWRVADKSVWSGWDNAGYNYNESSKFVGPPYSTPAAYYPYTDRVDGYSTYPGAMTDNVFIWTTERAHNLYSHRMWDTFSFDNGWGESTRMAVRCMKDISGQTGNGNDYVVDDEYVWE